MCIYLERLYRRLRAKLAVCIASALNIQLRTFSNVLGASNCRKLRSDGRKQSPEKNGTKFRRSATISDQPASRRPHDDHLYTGSTVLFYVPLSTPTSLVVLFSNAVTASLISLIRATRSCFRLSRPCRFVVVVYRRRRVIRLGR